MTLQRYDLTIEPNDSAYLEPDENGPWCLVEDAEMAIAEAGASQPLTLDVERLERAMREHILGREGWPHLRPGPMPGDGPEPVDGCSDICADRIATEYERLSRP